jgi:acyl carrier protein
MTDDGTERIKSLIASILEPRLVTNNMKTSELRDELDLRMAGIVDSLGFVQLLAALEARLGRQVDVAELAPDQLTKVGSLARHIASRHARS